MAEYQHGSMDTQAQKATFAGFIRLVTWAAGAMIVLLVLLALANA